MLYQIIKHSQSGKHYCIIKICNNTVDISGYNLDTFQILPGKPKKINKKELENYTKLDLYNPSIFCKKFPNMEIKPKRFELINNKLVAVGKSEKFIIVETTINIKNLSIEDKLNNLNPEYDHIEIASEEIIPETERWE